MHLFARRAAGLGLHIKVGQADQRRQHINDEDAHIHGIGHPRHQAGILRGIEDHRGLVQPCADAGGQHAEGHQIAERVDLDAVLLFLLCAVGLGAGDHAVKGVAQPADQQENGADVGMAVPRQGHENPDHGRYQ